MAEEKKCFGIDISNHSIKFVGLEKIAGKLKLKQFEEFMISRDIIVDNEVRYNKKLQEILFVLKKKNKIKCASISLPILDSFADLQIHKLVKELNFSCLNFEENTKAIIHAVIKENDDKNYIIVDFGETKTNIFIANKRTPIYSSLINLGGNTITKMIAYDLKINEEEAENLKKNFGIKKDSQHKDLKKSILKCITILEQEINESYINWYNENKITEPKKIEGVILCGGSANLPGLLNHLKSHLRLNITFANPWINIFSFDEEIPGMNFKDSLKYAGAIGLALENFQKK